MYDNICARVEEEYDITYPKIDFNFDMSMCEIYSTKLTVFTETVKATVCLLYMSMIEIHYYTLSYCIKYKARKSNEYKN